MYEAIVFLPLLGAIIAGAIALVGARNRFPGEDPPPPHDDHAAPLVASAHPHAAPSPDGRMPPSSTPTSMSTTMPQPSRRPPARSPPNSITSTLLVISCVLSWYAFFDVGFGGHDVRVPLFSFISFGDLTVRMGAAHRFADRRDAGRGDDHLVARPHLFDRLHGGGPVPAAVLLLSVVLHLRHADAGDGRQSGADVLRLGGRRARELSADRLLVSTSRKPMPPRSRPSSSTASAISAFRSAFSPCSI